MRTFLLVAQPINNDGSIGFEAENVDVIEVEGASLVDVFAHMPERLAEHPEQTAWDLTLTVHETT